MRLTDVARASVHELLGDFINFLMRQSLTAWEAGDPRFQFVVRHPIDKPNYGDNFVNDAIKHIEKQKSYFESYLNGPAEEAVNCLVALCLRINGMLTGMLTSQLRDFKKEGGFSENLTRTRLEARKEQATADGAPVCPVCGKPMLRRTIQRGSKQGQQFWGCSDYPKCTGTRN